MKNPVVIFVYRRPNSAQRVFDEVKKSKPPVLFFVSDGPRSSDEKKLVDESRAIVDQVDWDCQVIKIFSEKNLGCKQRFFTALDIVFSKYDKAIILEDDCVPNQDFFDFCNWGLDEFKDNSEISIISGSNLHPTHNKFRNGYSQYMNCWGWATWSRTWNSINRYIGLRDIKAVRLAMQQANFSKWEIQYWAEVFKHSICSNSIWDFYVQYHMLSTKKYSVYPSKNLVQNIGFDEGATHTGGKVPTYVLNNIPSKSENLMSLDPNTKITIDKSRDRNLASIIWSCKPINALRLTITNTIRLIRA